MVIAVPSIQRIVDVGGARLEAAVDAQLQHAVVWDRLAMPDMFVLTFRDPNRDVLSRAGLRVGARIRISTSSVERDLPEELISGEVTSVEADYDAEGSRAVVRGYDLSHRLNAGRKTKTYKNVKLSDVARQIARDAGLQADVDDSPGTFDHIIQANQSDLDFLYSLARRIGFDCRAKGEKLEFKRPTESSTAPGRGDFESEDPLQLVWQDNLLEFRARMSAVAQVSEVTVRGWSAADKREVIGRAQVSASNAEVAMSPAELATAVGGQSLVVVDRPVETQEAADELARAKAAQVGSAAFEATAVAVGSPALKAGVSVNVAGVDGALAGKWVITSARHEFGGGNYRTFLEFSGRQDRSLHGLVTNALPDAPSGGARVPGVVVAVVTDHDDPEQLGRVKVRYPWLSDTAESHWARVAAPGAGKGDGQGAGTVWLPEVGDEVIVGFIHGDFSHPIVLGALWNGTDKPPIGSSLFDAGRVRRAGFVSRKGHKLVFFDADDQSGVALITSDGKLRISINETNGDVHIVSDGTVTLEATRDIQIKGDMNVSIEAGGQLELKGQGGTKLESSGIVDIDGSQIMLN